MKSDIQTNWTSKIFFFGVLLFLIFFLPKTSFAKSYQFDNWQAKATINKDSTVKMVEDISIDFQGSFSNFWRSVKYNKLDRITNVKAFEVTDNGLKNVDFTLDRSLSEMTIKINDQINNEKKVYQLEYQIHGVVTYQSDWDEFYWNVTPSDIDVPINQASIEVTLPEPVGNDNWRNKIYSQASQTDFQVTDDNRVKFTASKLTSGQDFTIVLGWPKGIVDYKLNRTKAFQIIALILPILAIIGLIIFHYRKKDRLGLNKSIAPEFTPPSDDEPMLVGGLVNETISPSGLTASLVNIARKGYIKIIQEKKTGIFAHGEQYSFKKEKESFTGLPEFERRIAEKIFEGGKQIVKDQDLKDSFYKDYSLIAKDVGRKMVGKKWFNHQPSTIKGILGGGLSFLIFIAVFSSIFAEMSIRGIGFLIGSFTLSLMVWLIYFIVSTKKTKEGVEVWQKWQGFRMFLAKTEQFIMAELEDKGEKVEVGEGVFEKYLPYALVLGCADAWANRFKDFELSQPEWLEGDMRNFNSVVLASTISNLNTSTSSTILSSPSGGGGFGGGSGFSGGGAGGGAGAGGAGAS